MPTTPILYGPDGVTPIKSAAFGPIRTEKTLSLRDAEIMKDVTLWQMARQLEPTLICRKCWQNSTPPGNVADKDNWSIQIALTARNGIVATCGCSRWSTEQS